MAAPAASAAGQVMNGMGPLRRILTVDPALKVISLALAISLYFLVRADSVKELEVEVPIAVAGLQPDLVVTGEIPSSVRVRLRGPWSRLLRVLERRPAPYELLVSALDDADIHVFDDGRIRRLVGAGGLEITSIDPAAVKVEMEPKLSRLVPVDLMIRGQPLEGYAVLRDQIRYDPAEVRVTGPQSAVEGIERLGTAPVALDGMSFDLLTKVNVRKPEERHVTVEPDALSVDIPIRQRTLQDELVAVRVYVRNCAPLMRCSAFPNRVRVAISGPFSRVRELKELGDDQMAFVDAAAISEKGGAYDAVPIRFKRFDGIQFVAEPESVQVRVEPLVVTPRPVLVPTPPVTELDSTPDSGNPIATGAQPTPRLEPAPGPDSPQEQRQAAPPDPEPEPEPEQPLEQAP